MGENATYISVHTGNPREIKAEAHAYKTMPGYFLNIKTDAGTVTFHYVDMVAFKNAVESAYQDWEKINEYQPLLGS